MTASHTLAAPDTARGFQGNDKLLLGILAVLSIVMTVPNGGGSRDLGQVATSPAPRSQPAPDEEKAAILQRLSTRSAAELEAIEKQALLQELGRLDPEVLQRLVEKQRE